MTVESATYIHQLDQSLPTNADLISEGDDHLRKIKSTVKNTFPNITGAVTATQTEINHLSGVTSALQTQISARALKAGDSYTGAHNFTSATVTFSTPALGDNSQQPATTAFVQATAFSSVLPNQTGNTGKWLTTDGTNATWDAIAIGSVTGLTTALADKADDVDVVKLTGTQTVAGVKTFSSRSKHAGAYTEPTQPAHNATPTFDCAVSNVFEPAAMTGNVTSITMSNAAAGQTVQIAFQQDATGGRTVTVPTGAKIDGAIATGANRVSWLVMTFSARRSRWEGSWMQIPS